MLNQQTIEKLYALRMRGMADAFTQQQEEPQTAQLSFEERFALPSTPGWSAISGSLPRASLPARTSIWSILVFGIPARPSGGIELRRRRAPAPPHHLESPEHTRIGFPKATNSPLLQISFAAQWNATVEDASCFHTFTENGVFGYGGGARQRRRP